MNMVDERHLWVWYSPCGQGGVETYLLNMARETIRDGGAVWIAATHDVQGPLRDQLHAAGVVLLDWSAFHSAFMGEAPAQAIQQQLIADLSRIRPTLIALNDCTEFSIGAAPLLRRLRTWCSITDTFHIDSPLEQYLELRRHFVDLVDGFASTNAHVVARFRHRFPLPEQQVRYIANGVAIEDRPRRPADATLRMLYVGRLEDEQKQIMALPRLLSRLRDGGKQFSMTIVGDGPCRDALQAEILARGLEGQVRLTGYLAPDQVQQQYFEHDIFVNISRFEGFSMSVLEAFAAGCVPVCTDIDSLDRSAFLDGVNCRLCPTGALERMVSIWAELSPGVLAPLSRAAKQTGRRFTAEATYVAYREFLGELRTRRPLQPWPTGAETVLHGAWDISLHNPWIARPGRLRTLVRDTWLRLQRAWNGSDAQ